MSRIIAVTGSVTAAQRLVRELKKAGYSGVSAVHTPSQFNRGGCSYSVRAPAAALSYILRSARGAGTVKRVFAVRETLKGREYDEYDISR